MKYLNLFLAASLLIMISGTMNAQDETNPWSISGGVNVVDFFTQNQDLPSELGDLSEELFNSNNTLNSAPSLLSYVNVSRYIGKGFVAGASLSINEIDNFGETKAGADLLYASIDGEISYGFKKLLKSKWLDPYLQIGIGATKLEGTRVFGTGNGGLGVRLWVNENISLGAKTIYKQEIDNTVEREHFQHVFSLGVAFGGKDTDGDGINDSKDSCPTVFGLVEFNGCPDSDADGIEDSKDSCPNVFGLVEFNGCIDSDGDGISDDKDACPAVFGVNALNGCPEVDGDGDGIKDSNDNCPNVAGPRANNGCPWKDTDGDGILDKYDSNPTIADSPLKQNKFDNADRTTPVRPKVSVGVINELDVQYKHLLFDYNKSSIRSDSYEILDIITRIMKQYTNTSLLIEGHTDSRGGLFYNSKLSNKRTAAVKSYIENRGITRARIISEGYGETQPIATNNTKEGRQSNRRVELTIIPE